MKTTTDSVYFVLPEGATQEQQWKWSAIEDMCSSGQFSPDTRIFFPDENAWVRAGDTELANLFPDGKGDSGSSGAADQDEHREALQAEYDDAVRRINTDPDTTGALLEAGRLAAELGEKEAARDFFQKALDNSPFNPRVAQEVKRRYSKSECRRFRYLEREAPAWENLEELVMFPVSRGVVYPAVTALTTFLFLFLPHGSFALAALYLVWCVQIARNTASGASRLPRWQSALEEPVRELGLPLLAGLAVAAEFLLAFYAVTGLLALANLSGPGAAAEYVRNSPILIVLLCVVGFAYLPSVFVRLSNSTGRVFFLLDAASNVKAAIRMEHEYLMSVILLLVLGMVIGSLNIILGGVPGLGQLMMALVVSYSMPMAGFVLGRLLGRMRHLL